MPASVAAGEGAGAGSDVRLVAPRLTARQLLDRTVTHAAYQAQIVDLANRKGWAIMHVPPSRMGEKVMTTTSLDGKGWPDLVLFRPPRSVAIEVKTELDTVKPEQSAWHALLRACGWTVVVARPSRWDDVLALLT